MRATTEDGWRTLGGCRFHKERGILEANSVPVILGELESTLLHVLSERSEAPIPVTDLIAAIWPKEQAGDIRNKFDSLYSRLQKKLARAGAPILIENVHGVGYRLSVSSTLLDGFLDDVGWELPSADAAEDMSLAQFAQSLALPPPEGLLAPNASLYIDTPHPLERYRGGNERLKAMLTLGARPSYLMSAMDPDSIARLTRCLIRPSLRLRLLESSKPVAEAPRSAVHNEPSYPLVRIVVTPFRTSPDHQYFVNATDRVHASLVHFDPDRGTAKVLKRGREAYEHAQHVAQYFPKHQDTLIDYSPLISERDACREQIRHAVLDHIEPSLHKFMKGIFRPGDQLAIPFHRP